jgi:hypothetical protein
MSKPKKSLKLLERRQIWSSIYGNQYAEGICYYCIKLQPNTIRNDDYEVGHIEAKSKEGSEHPDNKLPICHDCNSMSDNGTKFMDLGRYKFPKDANHAHNPSKVYIKTQRDYKPMDANIKLIMENSIYDDEGDKSIENKPVPYSIAKYISDYKFLSWNYIYEKYGKWGKIIIEPISDFDVNILNPKKHVIKQKEYEITLREKQQEDKDLEVSKKYALIADYTFKTRGELDDEDIQYIIDYLWSAWYTEHKKYGTTNNVTLSGSKNKKVEYRNKATEETQIINY